MPGRTIAIGDVHGCAEALAAILRAIEPQFDDVVVTLGDYVDRGPDTRGVIDQLISLADRCELVPLMGNHEEMMLDALDDPSRENLDRWFTCGGREALASYGETVDDIPGIHEALLRRLQLYHETDDFIFVHANYYWEMKLEDHPVYRLLWAPLDMDVPRPHESGKTVIIGHTPQTSGDVLDLGHVVCIDTGCSMGGRLTAYDVRSGATWQADHLGNLRYAP